jgi:hypothetical protein
LGEEHLFWIVPKVVYTLKLWHVDFAMGFETEKWPFRGQFSGGVDVFQKRPFLTSGFGRQFFTRQAISRS